MRGISLDRRGHKPLMHSNSDASDSDDSDQMQYHQALTEESQEHDARSRASLRSRDDEHHTAQVLQPVNSTPAQPFDEHKIEIGEKAAKEKKERRKKDKKGKKEVFGEESLFAQAFDNDPWTQMPMIPEPTESGTVDIPQSAHVAKVPTGSAVVAPPWPPISGDVSEQSAPECTAAPAVRMSMNTYLLHHLTGKDDVSPVHATAGILASPGSTSPSQLRSPSFAPVVAVAQSPTSPRSASVLESEENDTVITPSVILMSAPLSATQESPKLPIETSSNGVPTAVAASVHFVPAVEATTVNAVPTVEATVVPAISSVEARVEPAIPTVPAASVPTVSTLEATAVPALPPVASCAVPVVPTKATTAMSTLPAVAATAEPAVSTVEAAAALAGPIVAGTDVPAVGTVTATVSPAISIVTGTAVPAAPMVEEIAVYAEGSAILPAHVVIASPVLADPRTTFCAPMEIKNDSKRASHVGVAREKKEEPTPSFSSATSPPEGVQRVSHPELGVELSEAPPSSAGSTRAADGFCSAPRTVQSAALDNQQRFENAQVDTEQRYRDQQQVFTVVATAVPAEKAAIQSANVVVASPLHVTSDPPIPFLETEMMTRANRAVDVVAVGENKVEPTSALSHLASPPVMSQQVPSRIEPQVGSGAVALSNAVAPPPQVALDSHSRVHTAWCGTEQGYPAQQLHQYQFRSAYQPTQVPFPPRPSEHVPFYDAPSIPLLFRCLLELPADQVNATLTQARVSRPELNDDRWFDEKMMMWGRRLSKELRKEMEVLPSSDKLNASSTDEKILEERNTFKKQLHIQGQHIMALSNLITNFSTHSTDHATLLHDSRKLVDEHAALVRMQRRIGADMKGILETTGADALLTDFLEHRRASLEREQNERTTRGREDELTESALEATRAESITMDTLSSAYSKEMNVAPVQRGLPISSDESNSSNSSSEDYEDDVKSDAGSPMTEVGKVVTFDPARKSEEETINGSAVNALVAADRNKQQGAQEQQPPPMVHQDISSHQRQAISRQQHQQAIIPPPQPQQHQQSIIPQPQQQLQQQPIIPPPQPQQQQPISYLQSPQSISQQQQQPISQHDMQQKQNVMPIDYQTVSAPTGIPQQQPHISSLEKAPSEQSTPRVIAASALPSPHTSNLMANAPQQPVLQHPFAQSMQQQQMYMMHMQNASPPTKPTLQQQQAPLQFGQPYMQPYMQTHQSFVPPQQSHMQPQSQDAFHVFAHAQMMAQMMQQPYGATTDQTPAAPAYQSQPQGGHIFNAPQQQEPSNAMFPEQQLHGLQQQLHGTAGQNSHITYPVPTSSLPTPRVPQPSVASEVQPRQLQNQRSPAETSTHVRATQSLSSALAPRLDSASLQEQLHVSVTLTPAQEKAFSEVHLMDSFAGLQDFANKEDDNLFGSDSENGTNERKSPQHVDDGLPDYNPVTGLPWVRR